MKLDEAEGDARDRFGLRPLEVIQWRNCHIGEYEIDWHREWYLNQGEDPKQVEAEYQDAKRRYREVIQAGKEWDKRVGIAPLRQEVARADRAADAAAKALAKTKPATPRGAGALVDYVLRDLFDELDHQWHKTALRTAVKSLIAA